MQYAPRPCNVRSQRPAARPWAWLLVAVVAGPAFGCAADAADDAATAAGVVSSGGSWRTKLEGGPTLQVGVAASRTLRVTTASGGDPGALSASVDFLHTAMNHGGLVDPTATVGAGGAVVVSDLQASMEGSWRLTLTLQDGAKSKPAEKVSFDFAVNP